MAVSGSLTTSGTSATTSSPSAATMCTPPPGSSKPPPAPAAGNAMPPPCRRCGLNSAERSMAMVVLCGSLESDATPSERGAFGAAAVSAAAVAAATLPLLAAALPPPPPPPPPSPDVARLRHAASRCEADACRLCWETREHALTPQTSAIQRRAPAGSTELSLKIYAVIRTVSIGCAVANSFFS